MLAALEGRAGGRWRDAIDRVRGRPWRASALGLVLLTVVAVGWWLGRPAAARPLDDAIPFAPGASVPAGRSVGAGQGPTTTAPSGSGAGSSAVGERPGVVSAPVADSGVADPGAPSGPTVVVHVAGAVAHPGIVRLAGGRRVVDAVEAAGGATAEADLDQLNLAEPVTDGMQVRVPRRGETLPSVVAGPGSSGAGGRRTGGPVNLNQASAQQLDQLPGIGPSLAAAIVAYRQHHGRFARVDDLLNVPGIGPSKLADLTGHVTV